MGLGFSSDSHYISDYNSLDKNLQLPPLYSKSKKNVCRLIRKMWEINETERITEYFDFITDIKDIEHQIFGDVDSKYFVLRLYVRVNLLESMQEKFQGLFSKMINNNVGSTHLAVQVANKVLHWVNSSFVLIKNWEAKGATAVFVPQNEKGEEVYHIENTPENRKNICELVLKWNCIKEYSLVRANCQIFAAEMFSCIGLNDNFSEYSGYVGDYLRYVSTLKGQTKDSDPCLVEKDRVIHKWTSHKDLDEWHHKNSENYIEANNLVKAFHRAYQMKGDWGLNCPFETPTILLDNKLEKVIPKNFPHNDKVDNTSSAVFGHYKDNSFSSEQN